MGCQNRWPNVPRKRTDPDLRFANNMKHARARIYSEACNGFVTVAGRVEAAEARN
jgi:hypothetical protein